MKSSLFSMLPWLCGALVGLGGCAADERNFGAGPSGAGGSGGSGQGGAGGGGLACSSDSECPAGENETAACVEGQCSVACSPGFLDCVADVPGCETSALAKESCGACGTACAIECVPAMETGPFCNDPIDISAGFNHTCVIRRDGTLWCWGRNAVGELGIPGGPAAVPVPAQVPLPGKATKVAAGGGVYAGMMIAMAHTCVILEDTTVYCWGSGNYGQLGLGGSISSDKPVQVTSLVNAVDISAGGAHTCAVKSDGDLYCWGSDEDGQLGNGMAPEASTPDLVMGNAKSVDAGQNHTCAITKSGTLLCWGKNFEGQLGTGDTTDKLAPAEVKIPLKLNVDEVAAGDRHTCARKGNEAYCFGNDYNGACAANKWGPVPDPTLVAVPEVTHIAVGRERSGAVSGAMGLVKMWGVAPLGDGGGGVAGTPVEVTIEGVAKIAGGYEHTCVLKTNGEVWCWGEDNDGQLGNGPQLMTELLPVPVAAGGPN